MQHVRSLNSAFHLDNLNRAWNWLLTNPEAPYKNYFRHVYAAYSLSTNDNLRCLSSKLKDGTYVAQHGIKIFSPKPSGVLRPITLLCIEDQIVYQALTNIIAEKLRPRIRRYYLKKNFGNVYAGQNSRFFYKRWQTGYSSFARALRESYRNGYQYIASFDLTACFDSIDHNVLKQMLRSISLEIEFCDYLCGHLRTWSAMSRTRPIYQEHGIPQGPMSSGLVAECVLVYFDKNIRNTNEVKYYRYIDDIRLIATSEKALRLKLVELDIRSKEIGLFPQTSKIHIHKISDVESEIKTISNPPETFDQEPSPDQQKIKERIQKLSNRYEVEDETRFKYVLASAVPSASLTRRLVRVVKKQPHLYLSIFNHIAKSKRLSRAASRECVSLLQEEDLYSAFTASLLIALRGTIHPDYSAHLFDKCWLLLRRNLVPEVRAAAGSILLQYGLLDWRQTLRLLEEDTWWARSYLIEFIRRDLIGEPSYESLINRLLRDDSYDVAVVAAEKIVTHDLYVSRPIRDINRQAQFPLRNSGLIGRVASDACYLRDAMVETLGPLLETINWRTILGRRYTNVLPKVIRWRGYSNTDPTAWVHITDTLNDLFLSALFNHRRGALGHTCQEHPDDD